MTQPETPRTDALRILVELPDDIVSHAANLEALCKELERELAACEARAFEWIPVSERLPEKGVFVWAWDAKRGANPSVLLADELWVITYDDAEISPTHWMPLPEPPGSLSASGDAGRMEKKS